MGKTMKIIRSVLALVILTITISCHAEIITVDDDGLADFNTIQEAINSSWHGDTIVVYPGIYYEPSGEIYFSALAITITSTEPNNPTVVDSTVISASVHFQSGEGPESVIKGFNFSYPRGIYCYYSSPTIEDNKLSFIEGDPYNGSAPTIVRNYISNRTSMGIKYCHGLIKSNIIADCKWQGVSYCNGRIADNTIIHNGSSADVGGGLFSCNGTIESNLISGNMADIGAGLHNCEGIIRNNQILNNHSAQQGAAAFSCSNLINNFIAGNVSESSDGILSGCTSIINNTIVGNRSTVAGYLISGGSIKRNNIIAFNRIQCDNIASEYNCFWDNYYWTGVPPGIGNITRDPLFVDEGYWDDNGTPGDETDDFWVEGDYHLKSEVGRWTVEGWVLDDVTSRCIDAGDPSDSIGQEFNPNGGRVNVGAYGGTVEASKSINGDGPYPIPECINPPSMDTNDDCKIDLIDFAVFASEWMSCGYDIQSACW